MRFVVYGAGAIGGVIGARLFQAGHDVTLIARGAHYEAIRDQGLRLVTTEETVTLPVPVVARPADAKFTSGDVVLLTMKTQDTTAALADLYAAAPCDIAVLCVQNGVENERLALRMFPSVYGVLVVLPATHIEPGVVRLHRAPPITGRLDVGRYPAGAGATARAIAAAFTGATFASQVRADVMRYKYGKLLGNLGNAVEVVVGRETGRDVARLAREEGVRVLEAAGVDVAQVGFTSDIRPAGGRPHLGSSTYQSLHRGTGTIEADFLNGEIVLLGREHGVPTPVNELLRSLADRMARERLDPGLMTAEEFLAALDEASWS